MHKIHVGTSQFYHLLTIIDSQIHYKKLKFIKTYTQKHKRPYMTPLDKRKQT